MTFLLRIAALAWLVVLVVPPLVWSATITVFSTESGGPDTLREAVANANSGDVIVFDQSIWGQTIYLATEILIDKNLTIQGPGADLMTISGGFSGTRLFRVAGDVAATIRKLKLENGKASNAPGGAIWNSASLQIDRCYFYNNSTRVPDDTGILHGGAIYNFLGGSLTITHSTFENNGVASSPRLVTRIPTAFTGEPSTT